MQVIGQSTTMEIIKTTYATTQAVIDEGLFPWLPAKGTINMLQVQLHFYNLTTVATGTLKIIYVTKLNCLPCCL